MWKGRELIERDSEEVGTRSKMLRAALVAD